MFCRRTSRVPLSILGVESARARGLGWPDVYYSADYGRCQEECEAARWELALWEPGPILYPYVLRPLHSEALGTCYDVASPYGYAGPWSPEDVDLVEWRNFREAFRASCRDRNIVSEFIRFHPLMQVRDRLLRVDPEIEAVRSSGTLSIDLSRPYDEIWKGYEGRARTAVRKARDTGYEVRLREAVDVDVASRSGFQQLYEQTMKRVEARSYYFFSDAYYEALWSALASQLLLGEVTSRDGDVVAAALFFRHGRFLHYHLAGSQPQHTKFGVNNMLLDAVARWGAENGFSMFHLGGGLKDNDSLYRFKASLGRTRHDFWIGRAVLLQPHHDRLVDEAARKAGVESQTLLEAGFFPAYRASVTGPVLRLA